MEKSNYLLDVIRGVRYLHENNRSQLFLSTDEIIIDDGRCVIDNLGMHEEIDEEMVIHKDIHRTAYSPLEVLQGRLLGEKEKRKADVWSIGVIAYELMY